jgi:type IV secretory pathway VirJ component
MTRRSPGAPRRNRVLAAALGATCLALGLPLAGALPTSTPTPARATERGPDLAPSPAAMATAASPAATPAAGATTFRLAFGRFGEVQVLRPARLPASFTILVSGERGPDATAAQLVAALVARGSAVVTIDGRRYLEALNRPGAGCEYLGGEFENLSHEVQRRLGLGAYLLPVLAGYSSGATLAAVVLEQSPKGTYAGLLSIDFQPRLDLRRSLCGDAAAPWRQRPGGGLTVQPATRGATPAVRLATRGDWPAAAARAQDRLARRGLAPPPTLPELRDLPLHEVPASGAAGAAAGDCFAVLLTGDGGWAGLDQDVSAALAAQGIPVVALNSLKYFWQARDPDAAALDLGRILERYRQAWHRDRVLLVGYSFGADVLPFLYRRLAPALRARVDSVTLLAPARTADFEFHLSDWIPGAGGGGRETVPEIDRMGAARVLCVYGIDDGDSPCEQAQLAGLQSVGLAGGHHFDGDFTGLAARMLRFAARPAAAGAPRLAQ